MDVIERRSWLGITIGYVPMLVGAWLIYLLFNHFWGDLIMFTPSQLLGNGLVWEGIASVWFIFAWGLAATVVILAIADPHYTSAGRAQLIAKGWWASLNAGVFEELIYRLFVLLNSMVVMTFLNFITFGLVKWLYSAIMIPVANFFTFGALEPQLTQHGWLLGAAIIAASIQFRDGHKHLGLLGWVNAWFIGMVMFWLVFNYGLLTAIVAHVIYDVLIFTLTGAAAKRTHNSWQSLLHGFSR